MESSILSGRIANSQQEALTPEGWKRVRAALNRARADDSDRAARRSGIKHLSEKTLLLMLPINEWLQ